MSFKHKGQIYSILAEHIWIGIILLCLGFFSVFLPLLYDKGVDDARAASTYTVCAAGCDYIKLFGDAGALAATIPGDTVEIWPGYSSSTEEWYEGGGGLWYNGIPTSSLTIMCSSTDVVIEGPTSTDRYEINAGGNFPGPSYQNCTFNDISLEVASSSLVSGNIFNRTTNTMAIRDVSVIGSNPSNITITNNTFNDDWGSSTSSQIMIQFDQSTGVHSNIVISSNTFNYEADGVSADPGVIVIPGGDFTIQGNYFKLGSNPEFGDSIAIIGQPSTASGPLNLTLSHNTFWVQNQATFFMMLNLDSGNEGTGYQSAYVTSTYNIFYSERVSEEGPGINGVSITWNTSTFSGTLYEDYNGNFGLFNYIQMSGSASSSFGITNGGNTISNDPNFKKLDVDTTNDMELAPFSAYLDVNGSLDIGAYSATRGTSFGIDDDGVIDYSTVHATNTAFMAMIGQNGDSFTLEDGIYNAFSLTGLNNITITGAGVGTIINAGYEQTGLYLTNINTSTISNMVIQNASSSVASYTASNAVYSYGGEDYIDSNIFGEGTPDGMNMILTSSTDCEQSQLVFEAGEFTIGTDVTALVIGENDWNLALIELGGTNHLTVFVPNNIYSSSSSMFSACSGVGMTSIDLWVPSVFSKDGEEFIYDSGTLAGLGVTMALGKTDPAYIEFDESENYGIRLDSSSNNTLENITSTGNTHGIHFKTTSANNNVSSSVFTGNILSDIYVKNLGTNNFKNTSFSPVSTTFEGDGVINVYEKARAYVTNSSTVALSGIGVTFTSADECVTETVTTTAAGYTPYTDHLLSWVMNSSTVAVTNGGYNPFTVASASTASYSASSTSGNLDTVNETFSLVLADAASPGVTKSTTTLAVSEGSTTSSYTVVLDSLPTNNVVIALATSTSDISLSTATLTFTTANWDTAQTVIVTAVDDSIDEDSEDIIITHTATSDDGNYDGISISNVTATVTDDDTAGVTISDTTMGVTEGGNTDTYTVVLDSQPSSTVSIALRATGSKVTLATSPVVFTTSNWDTPQTVTVTAVDDSTIEGTHSDTITATATSDDTNYDAISISDVTVTITDNDVASSGGGGGSPIISYPTKMDSSQKDFVINNDDIQTDSSSVMLNFNFKDASEMAVSNLESFENASFEDYKNTKQWTLNSGNGNKRVYAKMRSASGGTVTVFDDIELVGQDFDAITEVVPDETCPLTSKQSYKHSQSASVYYITSDCTKRAFRRSQVFFTYFDSWDDVKTTTKNTLDSIPEDALGFMPWGSKYDPKYGALVKTVSDPKVYLLLGIERYWITSETVFNTLKYSWNWIEDVATELLDKYTVGSEITYTDHHPNYTLIKYEDDAKVYRLEEGKKRYIKDEVTFNSLNYRWDRIVTIDDSEVYDDGEDLSL